MGSLLAAHILLLQLAGALDSCTYDQDAQREILKAMAAPLPSVVWTTGRDGFGWSEGDRAFTVSYGGCHHLGLSVSVEWPVDEMPTEDEIFRVGEQTAARFFSSTELALLRQAIGAREWTRKILPDGVDYALHVPDHAFYVQTQRSGGALKVTVAWSRTF
jgi:hypothetical protein